VAAVGNDLHDGSCLCGAVRFQARNIDDIWYCHCRQCRHLSGHYVAAAAVGVKDLVTYGTLQWARFSPIAEYAFCPVCGSPLFWQQTGSHVVSIFAGALIGADLLDVKGHIFVREKGSYYSITDGLPEFEGRPDEPLRIGMVSHD
jgi:hypothetical protein